MYISSHVIDVHAKCRSPSPMDPSVHVASWRFEFPHECISSVVEHQGNVVMHAAIAADLSAPHITHISVMNAVSFTRTLILGVLDLGTHGCEELRDECIAEQYINAHMAWHIQFKAHHTDAAVKLQRTV